MQVHRILILIRRSSGTATSSNQGACTVWKSLEWGLTVFQSGLSVENRRKRVGEKKFVFPSFCLFIAAIPLISFLLLILTHLSYLPSFLMSFILYFILLCFFLLL